MSESDGSTTRHSYSTGTSGGGSSAASDTSDAAALNALQDRGWVQWFCQNAANLPSLRLSLRLRLRLLPLRPQPFCHQILQGQR